MKFFLPTIFLLASSLSLLAQNYQIARSDRTILYQGISAFGIDSLEIIDGDTILYPFRRIDEISENCLSPFAPSFLGYQIIIKKDGYNLLFNEQNDTIKLKTNAQLGESWEAFNVPNHPSVMASVTSHDIFEFLERVDSVKTIQFNFKGEGNLINYLPHTLQLSKSFGFVNMLDFRKFPTMEAEPIPVVGFTNPKTGVQNITWFDVYDFQVGDIIHTLSSFSSCEDGGGRTKQITTILNRTDIINLSGSLDSIIYTQKVEKFVESGTSPHNLTSYFDVDTVIKTIPNDEFTYNFNPNFDNLPGYPYSGGYYAQNRMYYVGQFLAKYIPGSSEHLCYRDTCLTNCITDGDDGETYYQGLGGPYRPYTTGFFSCAGSSNELAYFEKGDSIWGVPLDLTTVPEYYNAQIHIDLFPNPASNYIQVQIDAKELPATFELFGAQGQQILLRQLESSNQRIELNTLNAKGIVIAKITNKGGYYNTRKIVIHP